ncbi:MAG TPA: copper resistance CopC family protein [bacterium]|nr:copper resistance CopC family protein [bacterium]
MGKTTTAATVWLVAVGVATLLAGVRVSAHAEMTKSSPANGAALTSSPSAIQAWFSEELATHGNYLHLYDAHNKQLGTGGLDPKVSSHEVLRLAPPRLSPGSYLVRWHVVSADDNAVTQGYFRFSIQTSAMSMPGSMALPALQLVAPADHSTVKNPVALIVETPGDIKKLTMGSMTTGQTSGGGGMAGMAPGVHLHILVDGVVTMPSSDQLTPAGTHRYQYMLAPLSPGPHTVKVFWADNKTHQPVGPVHAATCTVTQ